MAKNNNTDVKNLNSDQISSALKDAETNVSSLKFEHAVKGLQNPSEIKKAKKEVARLNTEVRARELSAMTDVQLAKRSRIRLRRRLK